MESVIPASKAKVVPKNLPFFPHSSNFCVAKKIASQQLDDAKKSWPEGLLEFFRCSYAYLDYGFVAILVCSTYLVE